MIDLSAPQLNNLRPLLATCIHSVERKTRREREKGGRGGRREVGERGRARVSYW